MELPVASLVAKISEKKRIETDITIYNSFKLSWLQKYLEDSIQYTSHFSSWKNFYLQNLRRQAKSLKISMYFIPEGLGMQKEELIQLHILFVQIKNEIEKQLKGNLNGAFKEYEQLGVFPHHVHKSKNAHKKAIFLLGKAIAITLSHNRFSEIGRVAERFDKLVAKI